MKNFILLFLFLFVNALSSSFAADPFDPCYQQTDGVSCGLPSTSCYAGDFCQSEACIYGTSFPGQLCSASNDTACTEDAFCTDDPTNAFQSWNALFQNTGITYFFDRNEYPVVTFLSHVYTTGYYATNPFPLFNADGTLFASLINNGSRDAYLASYDMQGYGQWVARITGLGNDQGLTIAADSTGLYVAGTYRSSETFFFNADGTLAGTLPDSLGYFNIFLVKYNFSGSVLWLTKITDVLLFLSRNPVSIATNYNGAVSLTASYDTATIEVFDADGSSVSTTLSNIVSALDSFVVTYKSNSGVVQWVARIAGTETGSTQKVKSIAADETYIYLTGSFDSNVVYFWSPDDTSYDTESPTCVSACTLSVEEKMTIFVVKYIQSLGQPVWATVTGASTPSAGQMTGVALATDTLGYLYASAFFDQDVVIYNADGSIFRSMVVNPAGAFDNSLIVRYAKDTGAAQWAFRLSSNTAEILDIAADAAGIVVTGYSSDNLEIYDVNDNPVIGIVGSMFAFVAQFTDVGDWKSANNLANNAAGMAITTPNLNNNNAYFFVNTYSMSRNVNLRQFLSISTCPPNVVLPDGTVCVPATACSFEAECLSGACQPVLPKPDNTPCGPIPNVTACYTGDRCLFGSCFLGSYQPSTVICENSTLYAQGCQAQFSYCTGDNITCPPLVNFTDNTLCQTDTPEYTLNCSNTRFCASGECLPPQQAPNGTQCLSTSIPEQFDCYDFGSCAAGTCIGSHSKPNNTVCGDAQIETLCYEGAICNATGYCLPLVPKPINTPCSIVDAQNANLTGVCNGQGQCIFFPVPQNQTQALIKPFNANLIFISSQNQFMAFFAVMIIPAIVFLFIVLNSMFF